MNPTVKIARVRKNALPLPSYQSEHAAGIDLMADIGAPIEMARSEIYFRPDVSLEELSVGIEAVTNDNIVELASSWFQPDKLAMVLLGDVRCAACLI